MKPRITVITLGVDDLEKAPHVAGCALLTGAFEMGDPFSWPHDPQRDVEERDAMASGGGSAGLIFKTVADPRLLWKL